jgi:Na+-driven multidrug efflux pump
MIFLGSLGAAFLLLTGPIIHLFTSDPIVAPLAATCLRILSCGNVVYAFGMVMMQAFNGAGDTRTPTVVFLFGYWLLQIPLAYVLAVPGGLQSKGAFLSILIAESAIAAASALLFRRGKWKEQRI